MTPERFERARELFEQAIELPEPERSPFITQQCTDDWELATIVHGLLGRAGVQRAEHAENPAPPTADALLGAQIGPYRIRAAIGQGGMGIVYEAEHERTRQVVALKLVRSGLATSALLRRFEFELQVLARLEHPGIARIHHADTADVGGGPQPYFAMELVRGQNLVEYAAQKRLTIRQRLELAAKIADAVQYAHQKGVIHRDLKPGNIFVTPDGQPKILDFGVARATDSDVQSTTLQSDIGQLIGTLPYMSPEQAGGDPNQIDTRCDVYALGVVLYELLTGRLPYLLQQKLIHEVVRIIKEDEPTRLSSLNRTLRGDVETIVGKALEKDKDRRYASANALAADIRRYLNDEPIAARPPSARYLLSKFARRNKALVGGVAATFLALLAGAVSTSAFAIQAYRDRATAVAAQGKAEAERQRAERFADELEASFSSANFGRGGSDVSLAEILSFLIERNSTDNVDPEVGLRVLLAVSDSYLALEMYDRSEHALNQARKLAKRLDDDGRRLLGVDAALANCKLLRGHHNDAAELAESVLAALIHYRDQMPDEYCSAASVRVQARADDDSAGLLVDLSDWINAGAAVSDEIKAGYYHMLGMRRYWEGRFAETVSAWRRALELMRNARGPFHRDTVAISNNLAFALRRGGDADGASVVMQEAVELVRKAFPDNQAAHARRLHSMAVFYVEYGDSRDARPLAEEAHKLLQASDERDSLTAARALQTLGVVRFKEGRRKEALTLLRQAEPIFRRTMPPSDTGWVQFLDHLAQACFFAKEWPECMKYAHELREVARVFGQMTHVADANEYLMRSAHAMGTPLPEKVELAREELELRRQASDPPNGPAGRETLDAYVTLGAILTGRNATEAAALLEEGLRLAREHHATDGEINYLLADALVVSLLKLELFAQAASVVRETLDIDQRLKTMKPEWRARLEKKVAVGTAPERDVP